MGEGGNAASLLLSLVLLLKSTLFVFTSSNDNHSRFLLHLKHYSRCLSLSLGIINNANILVLYLAGAAFNLSNMSVFRTVMRHMKAAEPHFNDITHCLALQSDTRVSSWGTAFARLLEVWQLLLPASLMK